MARAKAYSTKRLVERATETDKTAGTQHYSGAQASSGHRLDLAEIMSELDICSIAYPYTHPYWIDASQFQSARYYFSQCVERLVIVEWLLIYAEQSIEVWVR